MDYATPELDLKIQHLKDMGDLRFASMLEENKARDALLRADIKVRDSRLEMEFSKLGMEFSKIDTTFRHLDKEVQELKKTVNAVGIGLLLAMIGVVFPIAWTLWTSLVHFPAR